MSNHAFTRDFSISQDFAETWESVSTSSEADSLPGCDERVHTELDTAIHNMTNEVKGVHDKSGVTVCYLPAEKFGQPGVIPFRSISLRVHVRGWDRGE